MADSKLITDDGNNLESENVIEIEIPYPLFQYLGSDGCNIQNICRICLSFEDPVLLPMFSSEEHSVLATMFMAISEVQISEADGLPSRICPRCQTDMMNYYEFKMKCVKSDYTLKSVLKGEFITEEKPKDNVIEPKTELDKGYVEKSDVNVYVPEFVEGNTDVEYLEDIKESMSDDEALCVVQGTIDNQNEPKTELDKGYVEKSDVNVYVPEFVEGNTDVEYLEDIKESMSDDEALCVVQGTIDNQKEITVLDKDPIKFLKDVKKSNKTRKKAKHQCKSCQKKFNNMTSLKKHTSKCLSNSVLESQFPCKDCKEAFDSEFDLKIHSMLHNQQDEWKCTECQKEFKGRRAFRRHTWRHMRRRFVCEQCGAAFVEKYALRRHLGVHACLPREKLHACLHCDKRFLGRSALLAHNARHGTAQFACAVCGVSFVSRRLLASHERIHSSDKPYKCTYCDKRFRHDSTRNTHLRTHTGERPYICAQCGKSFIQNSNLALHMRTHTGERPYACTLCERKFSSSSTLKAHSRTHTGEKPYSCTVCGKSFARVSMKNHMRIHSGERPHACPAPACDRRFLTAPRLRQHYRTHTGEKPFECANCTQKFTTKCQLIKHVKKYEKKKKLAKKNVMLMPVTISDRNIRPISNIQTEKTNEYMLVSGTVNTPILNHSNLCTVQENAIQTESVIYQDDTNIKTNVIVLDSNPNIVTTNCVYSNDMNYNNDVNLVTVNEDEVSISASATVDGTALKLYQYDQSLLQIHTGGGHLTIRRISSKMTTNF